MKITRQRKVQKYLKFFKNHFGFREPYQLLVDATFCFTALKEHVQIKEQLPKYLDAEVKFLTTPCIILEVESLGPSLYGVLQIVKQFGLHKCGHEKRPRPGSKCLKSMVKDNNKNRYILLTQDGSLREDARQIPGTPIIYLHRKTPTMERPSDMSSEVVNEETTQKMDVSEFQKERLKELREKIIGETEKPPKKKRKKKGGPNPLSCLKKKKKPCGPRNNTKVIVEQPKKKRRRVKIAKHIREHWAVLEKQQNVNLA
ncbi:rRNA-processing protein UTP23 homolog [Artemia franciscana]|uniref:rRNA-processing protein UTP23 homolog n=1 Tax=Artemia franciscana TaxID=6661 RepID=UPI0032DB4091